MRIAAEEDVKGVGRTGDRVHHFPIPRDDQHPGQDVDERGSTPSEPRLLAKGCAWLASDGTDEIVFRKAGPVGQDAHLAVALSWEAGRTGGAVSPC